MADKDFQMERHYELWKEHNKQMGRWVFVILFLAIYIPLKGLSPYLKSADDLVFIKEQLEGAEESLSKVSTGEKFLAELETQLGKVKKEIDSNSWVSSIEQLKKDFVRMDDAYSRLQAKTPAQLFEAIPRLTRDRVIQQTGVEISGPLSEDSPEAVLNMDLIILGIRKEEMRAKTSPQPSFPITPISEEEFHALLETKRKEQPQRMADVAIIRTMEAVQTHAVNPVQDLLKKYEGKTKYLEALPALAKILMNDFNIWGKKYIGNKNWYKSVSAKDNEMAKVTATLEKWQETFLKDLNSRKNTVKKEKENFLSQKDQAKSQINDIKKEQTRLEEKMESVFPEWMRGFVDIKEMFQCYPLALLGIICFLGFKANLLRQHYHVIREGLIPKSLVTKDPSASSVWTLIYRGPLGTLVTALTYLVVILFLWNLFEAGINLTATWMARPENNAWPFIENFLTQIQWLGHTIFLATLLAFATILFLDWKNRNVVKAQSET